MKSRHLLVFVIVLGLLIAVPFASATETRIDPNTPGDGTTPENVPSGFSVVTVVPASYNPVAGPGIPEDFYRNFRDDWPGVIDNSKPDISLVYQAQAKILTKQLQAEGKTPAQINSAIVAAGIPSGWAYGLPASGTPKVPVFLVDFSDYPHNNGCTYQSGYEVAYGFNGPGYSSQYPYSSWKGYYYNSSNHVLNPSADVYGWYRAAHPRSYYTDDSVLVKEILNAYNPYVNFANYDYNGDGYLDGLFIKWSGPHGAWATQWWAMQFGSFDSTFSVDGKKVHKWVWSWYSSNYGSGDQHYYPRVDIHETGHLLGLPDLYDYTGSTYPKGGVGGYDMMDANYGDHNAWSKFMLGWTNAALVQTPGERGTYTMTASGYPVFVGPWRWGSMGENFLAQYVKGGVGNYPVGYPDGVQIWHVDSTIVGNTYNFSNSDGPHKYLKLMQADGAEHIETGGAGSAADFYVPGKSFTQTSNPNSDSYYEYDKLAYVPYSYTSTSLQGEHTGVSVTNFVKGTNFMNAYFNVIQPVMAKLTWTKPSQLDMGVQRSSPIPMSWNTFSPDYLATWGSKGSIRGLWGQRLWIDEYPGGTWYYPEIISGRALPFETNYWYYVQGWPVGTSIAGSGAKVQIFKNGAPYATYSMPATGWKWWPAYIDGMSGNVYSYNATYSSTSSSASLMTAQNGVLPPVSAAAGTSTAGIRPAAPVSITGLIPVNNK